MDDLRIGGISIFVRAEERKFVVAIYTRVLHVNIVRIIIYRPECTLFRVLYNIYDNVYVCATYKYDERTRVLCSGIGVQRAYCCAVAARRYYRKIKIP